MVGFWVQQQLFGITIDQVNEVIAMRPITRVPFVPQWIAGLINLRGEVVSVLDLGAFLGIGATQISESSRIVVVQAGARTGGLLADRIAEVQTVDLEQMQAPLADVTGTERYVAGLISPPPQEGDAEGTAAPRAPISALNLNEIFESERLKQYARKRGGYG